MNIDPFFVINKLAEDKLPNDNLIFTSQGFLNIGDIYDARNLAYAINESVDNKFARAGDIAAISYLNKLFLQRIINNDLTDSLTSYLKEFYSDDELSQFENHFYMNYSSGEINSSDSFLYKKIILLLNNKNRAVDEYKFLFEDDKSFLDDKLVDFLKSNSIDDSISFYDYLMQPIKKYPNSVYDQLEYIKHRWDNVENSDLFEILSIQDSIKEENKTGWCGHSENIETPDLGIIDEDYEDYSNDSAWMPKVIMLAKSTLVWLSQLTRTYEKQIKTLDAVPDEELDAMAQSGITCLWLIGIWERSIASKTIKQINGNSEAESSAYSLDEYEIAESLGGWDALNNLKGRCLKRGIRLSADMVPNHTAIDSKWISRHPDWFMQLDKSPFPQYSYNGAELSRDKNISVKLEDHYYDQTDCAVVFKRYDKNSDETRYIYHGNDGTGMPWNDTAQIDFLNPQAREAVIQTILHVARNFQVIRFDAAMTLAKKHIQRLWYPAPGQGGDIATRTENGMLTSDFNLAIPKEFWREVVDRITKEVPGTLLLAEAFWMMEGYFVRTLGMHRVYNSAFMHMMKNENNEKYRKLIRETLEFDPEILKRYVNFMNNPDEESAAEQFGTGDKYFGVCVLLSTLPGLPMIGHGQLQGYYEKYGMEFSKDQWNESVNLELFERHEKEIFPLFRKRYLFSEVENFRLYNFETIDGKVNENVYIYSNATQYEKALVIYNNNFERTSGRAKFAIPYRDKESGNLLKTDLNNFLQIDNLEQKFVCYKDFTTGLEYVREAKDIYEHGMFFKLEGFEYHILVDFKVVNTLYAEICDSLDGCGVENLDLYVRKFYLKPVLDPFKIIINSSLLKDKNINGIKFIEEAKKIEDSKFSIIKKKANLWGYKIEKNILQYFMDKDYNDNSYLENEFKIDKNLNKIMLFFMIVKSIGKYGVEWMIYELFDDIDDEFRTKCKIVGEIDLNRSFVDNFKNPTIAAYLNINKAENKVWFDGENMMEFIHLYSIMLIYNKSNSKSQKDKIIRQMYKYMIAFEEADYELDKLINSIQ